ncbi:exported hypothetical protein [Bradyrhizobium sp. ORS 375]|uniref:hypothetical protein n=1 Tax=Bradyrhizobium sp. (strain ORS 375) TaxID=566679 RepID=UPI0002409649|nr:hypothetical protein [Bradyrhizobium sp. ORS 375]CCD92759.1 exported hypothetical protein [Bradyrhizobium sp. ORS 375]
MNVLLRILLNAAVIGGLAGLSSAPDTAVAQTSPSVPGSGFGGRPQVGGTYQPRLSPDVAVTGTGAEVQRHKDFSGKPCLSVSGSARPFATNPKLFDHVVYAENGCPKAIKIQVCYLQASGCVAMDVPGYGRKEAVLGTMPSQKDFRFQFVEKF